MGKQIVVLTGSPHQGGYNKLYACTIGKKDLSGKQCALRGCCE